jgi:hypothetical protein
VPESRNLPSAAFGLVMPSILAEAVPSPCDTLRHIFPAVLVAARKGCCFQFPEIFKFKFQSFNTQYIRQSIYSWIIRVTRIRFLCSRSFTKRSKRALSSCHFPSPFAFSSFISTCRAKFSASCYIELFVNRL